MTRTPSPRSASPPPVTAPGTGSGTPPGRPTATSPPPQLRRSWPPTAEAFAPVSRAVDLGEISARAAHQVIRVAWTLADLAGTARPGPDECGQALAFQLGVAQ